MDKRPTGDGHDSKVAENGRAAAILGMGPAERRIGDSFNVLGEKLGSAYDKNILRTLLEIRDILRELVLMGRRV